MKWRQMKRKNLNEFLFIGFVVGMNESYASQHQAKLDKLGPVFQDSYSRITSYLSYIQKKFEQFSI